METGPAFFIDPRKPQRIQTEHGTRAGTSR